MKFKAVSVNNFTHSKCVDLIIKNKEVYNIIYLDHYCKVRKKIH